MFRNAVNLPDIEAEITPPHRDDSSNVPEADDVEEDDVEVPLQSTKLKRKELAVGPASIEASAAAAAAAAAAATIPAAEIPELRQSIRLRLQEPAAEPPTKPAAAPKKSQSAPKKSAPKKPAEKKTTARNNRKKGAGTTKAAAPEVVASEQQTSNEASQAPPEASSRPAKEAPGAPGRPLPSASAGAEAFQTSKSRLRSRSDLCRDPSETPDLLDPQEVWETIAYGGLHQSNDASGTQDADVAASQGAASSSRRNGQVSQKPTGQASASSSRMGGQSPKQSAHPASASSSRTSHSTGKEKRSDEEIVAQQVEDLSALPIREEQEEDPAADWMGVLEKVDMKALNLVLDELRREYYCEVLFDNMKEDTRKTIVNLFKENVQSEVVEILELGGTIGWAFKDMIGTRFNNNVYRDSKKRGAASEDVDESAHIGSSGRRHGATERASKRRYSGSD
ncbi:hypothetical protein HDU96_009807 [Phlyctochytrium bullatum]|nr:hypothetical protein HDU96_009807 [Phlyctochytrium bullatum]